MKRRKVDVSLTHNTGKRYTGKRKPVSPLPLPLRNMLRQFCTDNGIFMDPQGQYIMLFDDVNGKGKIKEIKFCLNYHKTQDKHYENSSGIELNIPGREYIIASNHRMQKQVNVTRLMAHTFAFDKAVSNTNFDDKMKQFILNLTQ